MIFSVPTEALRSVTRIITHADCPDGIASAMILHDALPQATIEFVQYKTPEHRDLVATPGMLFCDMTPPRERVAEFVEVGAIVLDHHKGADDIVRAFGERGVFADEVEDRGVSGALLAYHHVWLETRKGSAHIAAVHKFATLAGVRDTWLRTRPDWDAACAQAEALVFLGADALAMQSPYLDAEYHRLGATLRWKRRATADNIAQHKLYRLGGWRIFNDGKGIVSDVAEAVRELDPEAIGVCGFHYAVQNDGGMALVFSMRSCGDLDVAAIAKANGGGGHTKAAGFSVPTTAENGPADPITIFAMKSARQR